MTHLTPFLTRCATLAAIAGALALSSFGGAPSAVAHEAACPFCNLPVVQDTEVQDNEVALKYGRKRIEYRCVFCTMSEANSDYKGDLTIIAPGETKGAPIQIARTGDKWTASVQKDGAWQARDDIVFAAEKVKHKFCQTGYRAFTNQAAFEAWVKANPDVFDAKSQSLTLAQMVVLTA